MVSPETPGGGHPATMTKFGGESDISTYCAYNFPAVLQTVGSGRWGELSDTYQLRINTSKYIR